MTMIILFCNCHASLLTRILHENCIKLPAIFHQYPDYFFAFTFLTGSTPAFLMSSSLMMFLAPPKTSMHHNT